MVLVSVSVFGEGLLLLLLDTGERGYKRGANSCLCESHTGTRSSCALCARFHSRNSRRDSAQMRPKRAQRETLAIGSGFVSDALDLSAGMVERR